MAKALTPTQVRAVDMAVDHGRTLVRWPGGFWTYPTCPVKYVQHNPGGDCNVPADYVSTGTIEALIRRRVFVVTETRTARSLTDRRYEYPVAVTLTEGATA